MQAIAEEEKRCDAERPKSRWKAWGQLIGVLAALWLFAMVVGPYFEKHIPVFDEIVRTIDKQDIDSGAYFYSEIKASEDGERYLRSSLELGAPDKIGLTLPFVSGIAICLLLLWLGFRYMPLE